MHLTKQLLGTTFLSLASLVGVARAQSDASASAPAPSASAPAADNSGPDSWTLGRTYFQLDAGIEKFLHAADSSTGAIPGFGVNLPLGDNFDYGFAYAYEHAANNVFTLNDNTLETGLTAYDKMGWIAPFANFDLGYDWQRNYAQSIATRYDHPLADLGGGFEIPVTKQTSLRADLDYTQSLRKPHQNDLSYGFSANAWLNSAFGTFVGADRISGYSGAKSGTVYSAGVRFALDSP